MCALFFIKKGFPFVSVLDGGFAAAYAWLARDCKDLSLSEVLVEYDQDYSLFADLERSYQEQKEFASASARRKTSMAMQKLIDNSMVRLSTAESQIEGFTDRFISARKEATERLTTPEKQKNEDSSADIAETGKPEAKDDAKASASAETNSFKSAFTGMGKFRVNQKEKADSKPEENRAFDFSKISFGKGKADNKPDDTKAFDFSKISFGRGGRNPFSKNARNVSKEDVALEKEIEASLSPPENPKDVAKGKGENTSFKDALKSMPFNKFNAMNPKPKSEPGALREEEAILFEDED